MTRRYGLANTGMLAVAALLATAYILAPMAVEDQPGKTPVLTGSAERSVRAPDAVRVSTPSVKQREAGGSVDLTKKLALDREMSQGAPAEIHRVSPEDMPVLARAKAGGQVETQMGWVEGHRVDVKLLPEPPELTPELRQMVQQACEAERLRGPSIPVTGAPDKAMPMDPPTEPGGPVGLPGQTRAPGDFQFFVNEPVTPAGASTSVVAEPSVGNNDRVIFQSGNWYAAISYDDGHTWLHVDPYTTFPSVNGGFCCDQIVIYEPSRDMMFWLLQYNRDATSNTHRFAIANGVSSLENLNWCLYDFNPAHFGIPADHWLDFPDLVLGDNVIYYTTNVFTTQTFCDGGNNDWGSCTSDSQCFGFPCRRRYVTSVVARFPLDPMTTCSGFGFGYWNQLGWDPADRRASWRGCHGTTSTFYWAAHNTTDSIRIFRWEESSGSITLDDVAHDAFSWDPAGMTCPGPDGNDACARADTRILGAYNNGLGELGFMWISSAHGGFPDPYTRIARFRESDRALIANEVIWWDQGGAWIYPSVGVNSRGHVAGTIFFSGGNLHPQCDVWISDNFSPSFPNIAPAEIHLIAQGTDGPASDKWGDYLTTRPHSRFPETWIGTGFTLQGGPDNDDVEPRHVWFGREQDAPPVRPPNDDCDDAYVIYSTPYASDMDTRGATKEGSDPVPSCTLNANSNTVWYTYTPPCDGTITVETCNSEYDTVLTVYTGVCGDLSEIACDDDGCGEFLTSWIADLPVTGGIPLYIEVADYNVPGGGTLRFRFDFTPDPGEVPSNDLCEDATYLGSDLPSSMFGTTLCASVDDVLACGTTITSPGVWYRVRGTGHRMTATTCNDGTGYDTKLSVYCFGCDTLACVVGNDDDCVDHSPLSSTVTWCSQYDTEYLILVHGFGGASGDFQLDVYDDGTPCTGAIECGGETLGACCIHGGGTCTPGTCGNFSGCGGGECVCALSADGDGVCATAAQFCEGLAPCPNGSSDCPQGTFCWVGSCCDGPVCAALCPLGGAAANDLPEAAASPQVIDLELTTAGSSTPMNIGVADKGTPNVSCLEIPELICYQASGIYIGDSVSCERDTCLGACCVNGDCVGVMEELECDNAGGDWFHEEDCSTVTCPPPNGACCPPYACTEPYVLGAPFVPSCSGYLGRCVCFGTYDGDIACIDVAQNCGPQCLDGVCPTGMICVLDTGCYENTPTCVLSGCPLEIPPGRALEPGEIGPARVLNPEVLERGGVPMAGCIETDQLTCEVYDGAYQGDQTVCRDQTCPVSGACCFLDGGCIDALTEECLTLGGDPREPGTSCAGVRCPVLGACCVAGECIGVMEAGQCEGAGGTWFIGQDCSMVTCPGATTGACCAPYTCTDGYTCEVGQFFPCDGTFDCTCVTTTEGELDCVHIDQLPNPPQCRGTADCPRGTVCVTNLCDDVQLCLLRCSEPLPPRGGEDAEPATFFGDPDVHRDLDVASRGVGQPADCLDTTPRACEEAYGLFQGLGTTCANTICPGPIGACCINGECVDNTEEIPCLERGGQWFEGEDCRDFTCPIPTQACCSPDGRECIDEVPDVCRELGGIPGGPGTFCLGDQNGNDMDDACEPEPPCEDCGPGPHWIDECREGTDHMPTGALIGIDLEGDCVADMTVRLSGPVHISRSNPLDDSDFFPGSAPIDGHFEVIDTEIVSMSLSGGGVTMTAGGGLGQIPLRRSLGAIVEQPSDAALGDSHFEVFVEVDLGGGNYVYNQDPLPVIAKINCVPPDATYIHPIDCVKLLTSPIEGQGEVVAYLVTADHSTYPDCGDPVTGDCFEPNGTPFCDNEDCCVRVCDQLPRCCEVMWDLQCVAAAQELCIPPQACCLPDGSCMDLPPDICAELEGGIPQGVGTECEGDSDQNGVDDACQVEEPCEDCGPGPHWIDQCRAGNDQMGSGALIGIDMDGDCVQDTTVRLTGPVNVSRSDPRDDSMHFPGLAPLDGHLEVLDTEILAMHLTGGGMTMIAGGGLGQAGVLRRSLGAIVEQRAEPTLGDTFFDVFFEVDLGGGHYVYNHEPLRVSSKIDCVPPDTTYIHPFDCIPLYNSPYVGQGDVVARLVRADHSTHLECGDPATGDCFVPNDSPYCDNEACCLSVCEVEPRCCEDVWAPPCAEIAHEICREACCLPEGRCQDLPPHECVQELGGEPQGYGTQCEGDGNGNNVDDACEFDEPCEDCGPGIHWVDGCRGGIDDMPSAALVGLDLDLDCRPDTSLRLTGPVTVRRSYPRDDSIHFPGTRPIDGHPDVLDTEIVSMVLTRGAVTLTAGDGLGQGGVLWPSYGVIAEQRGDNTMADSFFDVFFEVDLGANVYAYNHEPLRVNSKIECVPPNTTYIHPTGCIPLFDKPPLSPAHPTIVANLVTADHSTFPARILRANPEDEHSLWRSQHNIVRIWFDDDISVPRPGEILIREMLPAGAFGPDVSNQFSFTVENNGSGQPRVLRVWENGSTLRHRHWYAVANHGGWSGVSPFELQYVVQVGDASNDGQVFGFDVNVINTGIPTFAGPDDDRRDMNGDFRILAFDVSITNGSIPSPTVAKPSGHP